MVELAPCSLEDDARKNPCARRERRIEFHRGSSAEGSKAVQERKGKEKRGANGKEVKYRRTPKQVELELT